jgi:hypothetical protein
MKAVRTIIATTAALAVGGLFAAQASADPTNPAPRPADAAKTAGRGGGQGVGWFFTVLTDAQRTCVADAGLQRPEGKLTDASGKELRSDIDAALAKCDVSIPARLAGRDRLGFRWAALTAQQQHCLAGVTLTRPVGRLTEVQRAAVRQAKVDAVASCTSG